ncbi:MAG: DUF3280 domain-containing protein [Bacteroidota bacterium]|nr:DUF3280 domain-containing protein [Kiloniellaceae bacterium]
MLRSFHVLVSCLTLAGGLTALVAVFGSEAQAAEPIRIAVFEFELDDRSAGGSVVAPDAADAEHLKLSTEEARRLLTESGRYEIVDTGGAAEALRAAGGVRHCKGCEGALAGQLGAEQSLAGLLTRITRTEYTLQIVVRDTATGAVLSNGFTGLRMGANYAWPRGTRWLVNKSVLD